MKNNAISNNLPLDMINAIQIEAIRIFLSGLIEAQCNPDQIEKIKANVTDIFNTIDRANRMSSQPRQFWVDGREGIVESLNQILPDCIDPKY